MPHTPLPPQNRSRAKKMRRVMTDAELKLWNELRAHRLMGLGFRRQVPIGTYIVDFACSTHRLVVEVDGSQHAEDREAERDNIRTAFLKSSGWTILRFWNDDVLRDIDDVCQHIVIEAGLGGAISQPEVAAGQRPPLSCRTSPPQGGRLAASMAPQSPQGGRLAVMDTDASMELRESNP